MSNTRRFAIGLCAVMLVLLIGTPSFAHQASSHDSRVVMILLPRVTWERIRQANTPYIDDLAQRGSVASLSVRTPGTTRTIEKGYASLAWGNRALASSSQQVSFLAPHESYLSVDAGSVFRDEQGEHVSNAAAVTLGFERMSREKDSGLYPAEVGSFARALHEDNKSVAVFGNIDPCMDDEPRCYERPVGYLGVDHKGVVRSGDVSRDLLNEAGMVDMNLMAKKTIDALGSNDVTISECSNLERIENRRPVMSEEEAKRQFNEALTQCDAMIGKVVEQLDLSKDRLFIVAPVPPHEDEQLTAFIAAGKEIPAGYATGGITRREGIVALGDLAPSILTFLGVTPPDSMVSTLLGWDASESSGQYRISKSIGTNKAALLRDHSFVYVAAFFIAAVFISIVISLFAYRKFPALVPYMRAGALLSGVMPTVTFIMDPLMLTLGTTVRVVIAFILFSVLAAGIVYACARRWGYVRALLGLTSVTLLMHSIDVITGGRLQLNSLFGYSPIVAGRFAGFGNLAFSIIAISAVVFVALVKQLLDQRSQRVSPLVHTALLVFLAFILFLVGAPIFGSDVGGVLSLTPTIVIIGMMLFNKKISLRSVALASLTTLAAITLFSLFDLSRPLSERTHLGRFVHVLIKGEAGVVIERKLLSNFHILTNSPFASLLILGTIFAIFLFMKPEQFIKQQSEKNTVVRYLAYPGLIVGVLGMLLNDSGVAIPGMMIAIAYPVLALIIFDENTESKSSTTLPRESV